MANEIRAEVTRDASAWKHLNLHASAFSVSLLLWPPTFQMEDLLSARVIVWGRRGTEWGMMLTRSKPSLSHWILEPSPQHNLAYPDRCVLHPLHLPCNWNLLQSKPSSLSITLSWLPLLWSSHSGKSSSITAKDKSSSPSGKNKVVKEKNKSTIYPLKGGRRWKQKWGNTQVNTNLWQVILSA